MQSGMMTPDIARLLLSRSWLSAYEYFISSVNAGRMDEARVLVDAGVFDPEGKPDFRSSLIEGFSDIDVRKEKIRWPMMDQDGAADLFRAHETFCAKAFFEARPSQKMDWPLLMVNGWIGRSGVPARDDMLMVCVDLIHAWTRDGRKWCGADELENVAVLLAQAGNTRVISYIDELTDGEYFESRNKLLHEMCATAIKYRKLEVLRLLQDRFNVNYDDPILTGLNGPPHAGVDKYLECICFIVKNIGRAGELWRNSAYIITHDDAEIFEAILREKNPVSDAVFRSIPSKHHPATMNDVLSIIFHSRATKCLDVLLRAGIHPDSMLVDGKRLLILAIKENNHDFVSAALNAGAAINPDVWRPGNWKSLFSVDGIKKILNRENDAVLVIEDSNQRAKDEGLAAYAIKDGISAMVRAAAAREKLTQMTTVRTVSP